MLEELRKLSFTGGKGSLVYFLKHIIGSHHYSLQDLRVLCSLAPKKYSIVADAMIQYCIFFNWLEIDEKYFLTEKLKQIVNQDEEVFNNTLVQETVDTLFNIGVLTPNMFYFDIKRNKLHFKNEMLPLVYSEPRNVLINQGLFEIERFPQRTLFFVAENFEDCISDNCNKKSRKLSLERLLQIIEENSKAGELAEQFTLEYEIKRLPKSHSSRVKIISKFDVGAGYDILSFESKYSTEYDRLIEVKAISKDIGFYWSRNEYEVAKLNNSQYYLYLVDLNQIQDDNYSPLIINNPAESIMKSENWLVEADSYHIKLI